MKNDVFVFVQDILIKQDSLQNKDWAKLTLNVEYQTIQEEVIHDESRQRWYFDIDKILTKTRNFTTLLY